MATMIASGKGSSWDSRDAPHDDGRETNSREGKAAKADEVDTNGGPRIDGENSLHPRSIPALPGFSTGENVSGDSSGGGKNTSPLTPAAAGDVGISIPSMGNGAPSDQSQRGVGDKRPARSAADNEQAPGIPSTCKACTTPKLSRRVKCDGCDVSFHWSCMGFYEHNYKLPPKSWKCKTCKTAEDEAAATGLEAEAGESESGSGEIVVDVVGMAGPTVHGVGLSIEGGDQVIPQRPPPRVGALPTSPAVTSSPMKTSTAGGADAGGSSGGGGEKRELCPVCGKDMGRKRTIRCSKCETPSHANCVNVKGAETPKEWVCRNCQAPPGDDTGAEGGRGGKGPGVAATTVGNGEDPGSRGTAVGASAEAATARAPPVTRGTVRRSRCHGTKCLLCCALYRWAS